MNQIMVGSGEQFNVLKQFLEGLAEKTGMQMIPCDDVISATKGIVAFYGEGDNEKMVSFGWQFAKPIEGVVAITKEIATSDEPCEGLEPLTQRETVVMMVETSISEQGWVKADDPKRCILGFARHKPITSSCPSQGLVLTMEAFFELPSELRERVNAWRMKKTKEALEEAGIA